MFTGALLETQRCILETQKKNAETEDLLHSAASLPRICGHFSIPAEATYMYNGWPPPLSIRVWAFLKFVFHFLSKPENLKIPVIVICFTIFVTSFVSPFYVFFLSKTLKVQKVAPLVVGEMLLIYKVSSTSPSTFGSLWQKSRIPIFRYLAF